MAKRVLGGVSLIIVVVTMIIFFVAPAKMGIHASQPQTTSESSQQVERTVNTTAASDRPQLPAVHSKDWELLLVNWQHPIKNEASQLQPLKNGYLLDERVIPFYEGLADDAQAAGIELAVISAFRSVADQEVVYDQQYQAHLAAGLSEAEAITATEKFITKPGTSEHHTGLALDVLDVPWYNAEKGLEPEFGETTAGQWLEKNAHHYGFIVRYLKGKEKVTNINYEPWHLRYVGSASATYMYEHGLVLEEYLTLLGEAGQ